MGYVHILDGNECPGCGFCQEVCPVDAIVMAYAGGPGSMDLKGILVDQDICICCGECENYCFTSVLEGALSRAYICEGIITGNGGDWGDWGDWGDDPGGGGGGNPNEEAGNISKKVSLSNTDKNTLNEKIKELKEICAYKALFRYLNNKGTKLNDIKIDSNIGFPAYYNHVTNEIVFQSSHSIENNRFDEEFIHFFQHNFYPEGLSKYTNKGRINIEFEAKLINDLICNKYAPHQNGCLPITGGGAGYNDEYLNWIGGLTITNGFPSYQQIKNEYWQYMEGLRTIPEYNYPVDETLTPEVLDYISRNADCE